MAFYEESEDCLKRIRTKYGYSKSFTFVSSCENAPESHRLLGMVVGRASRHLRRIELISDTILHLEPTLDGAVVAHVFADNFDDFSQAQDMLFSSYEYFRRVLATEKECIQNAEVDDLRRRICRLEDDVCELEKETFRLQRQITK